MKKQSVIDLHRDAACWQSLTAQASLPRQTAPTFEGLFWRPLVLQADVIRADKSQTPTCLYWKHSDVKTIGAATSPLSRALILIQTTTGEITMNWERIEGNWKQAKGKAKEQWGKLTDDDMDVVAGRRDQLAGKIQERYGIAKEEAEKQLGAWERSATDDWFR
jgi:uncharacterized protein YjbJ (UPF0337 family)